MKKQILKNPTELSEEQWDKKCDMCGSVSSTLNPPSEETDYMVLCDMCKLIYKNTNGNEKK